MCKITAAEEELEQSEDKWVRKVEKNESGFARLLTNPSVSDDGGQIQAEHPGLFWPG